MFLQCIEQWELCLKKQLICGFIMNKSKQKKKNNQFNYSGNALMFFPPMFDHLRLLFQRSKQRMAHCGERETRCIYQRLFSRVWRAREMSDNRAVCSVSELKCEPNTPSQLTHTHTPYAAPDWPVGCHWKPSERIRKSPRGTPVQRNTLVWQSTLCHSCTIRFHTLYLIKRNRKSSVSALITQPAKAF